MFKLFKLNVDRYIVLHYDGKEFEGNEKAIITYLLNHGVESEELVLGISALETDEMAEYGVNKMFIFSKKLSSVA